MRTTERAQSVRDLSLMSRTHIKNNNKNKNREGGMRLYPSSEEAETGRSMELTDQTPYFQSTKDPTS